MTSPAQVNSNFLTEEECKLIFDKLLIHKDKWTPVADTDASKLGDADPLLHRAYFFGVPVYAFNDVKDYVQAKTLSNEILSNEFGNIYVKLRDAISNSIGIDAYYCDDISYPGFHIFGPGLVDEPVTYNYFHFHTDGYPAQFQNIIPYSDILSFIVAIRLPKTGGSLTYNENDVYQYQQGSLAHWSGKIPHKISDFVLDGPDDYRITWQIHVAVCGQIGIIFW